MSQRLASSFLLILLLSTTALIGCSVYKSEGRKFLEEQGITFAANSSAASEWSFEAKQLSGSCAELTTYPHIEEQDWKSFEASLAPQFKKESLLQSTALDAFDVLYCVEDSGRHFLCAFYFDSQTDRESEFDQQLEAARRDIENLRRL